MKTWSIMLVAAALVCLVGGGCEMTGVDASETDSHDVTTVNVATNTLPDGSKVETKTMLVTERKAVLP